MPTPEEAQRAALEAAAAADGGSVPAGWVNAYVAPNGSAIALRDDDGAIVGEAEDGAEDEPAAERCGLCRRLHQPAIPGDICADCRFWPLD